MRKTYANNLWRFAVPVDTKFRDSSEKGVFPSVLDANTHGVRAYSHLLDDLLAQTAAAKGSGRG